MPIGSSILSASSAWMIQLITHLSLFCIFRLIFTTCLWKQAQKGKHIVFLAILSLTLLFFLHIIICHKKKYNLFIVHFMTNGWLVYACHCFHFFKPSVKFIWNFPVAKWLMISTMKFVFYLYFFCGFLMVFKCLNLVLIFWVKKENWFYWYSFLLVWLILML